MQPSKFILWNKTSGRQTIILASNLTNNTKHLTSQTANFFTINIDNDIWSIEQEVENNASLSVNLIMATIKRVLLHKILEEFVQEILDSSRMRREQWKMSISDSIAISAKQGNL